MVNGAHASRGNVTEGPEKIHPNTWATEATGRQAAIPNAKLPYIDVKKVVSIFYKFTYGSLIFSHVSFAFGSKGRGAEQK